MACRSWLSWAAAAESWRCWERSPANGKLLASTTRANNAATATGTRRRRRSSVDGWRPFLAVAGSFLVFAVSFLGFGPMSSGADFADLADLADFADFADFADLAAFADFGAFGRRDGPGRVVSDLVLGLALVTANGAPADRGRLAGVEERGGRVVPPRPLE